MDQSLRENLLDATDKEHLKNSSLDLIVPFKYYRYFHYSSIFKRPLRDMTCFDLFEKCRLRL